MTWARRGLISARHQRGEIARVRDDVGKQESLLVQQRPRTGGGDLAVRVDQRHEKPVGHGQ